MSYEGFCVSRRKDSLIYTNTKYTENVLSWSKSRPEWQNIIIILIMISTFVTSPAFLPYLLNEYWPRNSKPVQTNIFLSTSLIFSFQEEIAQVEFTMITTIIIIIIILLRSIKIQVVTSKWSLLEYLAQQINSTTKQLLCGPQRSHYSRHYLRLSCFLGMNMNVRVS